MEELVDESYLVEYTLREMDSLAPPTEAESDRSAIEGSRDVVMLES